MSAIFISFMNFIRSTRSSDQKGHSDLDVGDFWHDEDVEQSAKVKKSKKKKKKKDESAQEKKAAQLVSIRNDCRSRLQAITKNRRDELMEICRRELDPPPKIPSDLPPALQLHYAQLETNMSELLIYHSRDAEDARRIISVMTDDELNRYITTEIRLFRFTSCFCSNLG